MLDVPRRGGDNIDVELTSDSGPVGRVNTDRINTGRMKIERKAFAPSIDNVTGLTRPP